MSTTNSQNDDTAAATVGTAASSSSTKPMSTTILSAPTKAEVSVVLCHTIMSIAAQALSERGVFSMALSGGSLPSLLSALEYSFAKAELDPQFSKWHIILADERCVPNTHDDSNWKLLQQEFLAQLSSESNGIPVSQIHGLNQELLSSKEGITSHELAADYEQVVKQVIQTTTGGKLDLAVLGFGPDGHTCSLFPNHVQIHETKQWVVGVEDSPKPPARRITLTLPVLNYKTRHVIFCGTGSSKAPILQAIFESVEQLPVVLGATEHVEVPKRFVAQYKTPPPYPCAMVQPQEPNANNDNDNNETTERTQIPLPSTSINPPSAPGIDTLARLMWIVDHDAMTGVVTQASSSDAPVSSGRSTMDKTI